MFKVITIDPSTTNVGIVISAINQRTFKIIKTNNYTFIPDKNAELDERLWIIYKHMTDLFNRVKPDYVIHETSFSGRLSPAAAAPLAMTIWNIRLAYMNLKGSTRGLFKIPPISIKAAVGNTKADKDEMLILVKSLKELKPFLTGLETEHEIDAIAILYTFLKYIRSTPEVLLH